MYIFSHCTYIRLSELLLEAISDSDYFNGSVTLITEQTEIILKLSTIIYRDKLSCKQHLILNYEDQINPIVNISPVWWEVTTTNGEGEMNNDFDFKILKNIILI